MKFCCVLKESDKLPQTAMQWPGETENGLERKGTIPETIPARKKQMQKRMSECMHGQCTESSEAAN
jgi:hypothetical protein